MTIKLTYAGMRQGKARSAILPIVARMAIAALPLVSALPAAAQTARTPAQGYTEMKDTSNAKMKSTSSALPATNPLRKMGCSTKRLADEAVATTDLTGFSALIELMTSSPIPTRQVIATDIWVASRPALNNVSLAQTAKPTPAMAGDVISQFNVEYMTEYAGYMYYGWKVMKIDSKGVELAPTLSMEILMSEHTSGDYVTLGVRIPYGTKKVVSGGPSISREFLKLPLEISVSKGQKPGTASISAVFLHPERGFAGPGDGAVQPQFIHAHDTSVQRVVKVGSAVEGFGKITRIDAKGVEFSNSGVTYGLGYGQKRTIGEYGLHQTITVKKGKAPGTAILAITMPVMPKDTAKQ